MTPAKVMRPTAPENGNAKPAPLVAAQMRDMAAMKERLPEMYAPPRRCKVFVGGRPAGASGSGL